MSFIDDWALGCCVPKNNGNFYRFEYGDMDFLVWKRRKRYHDYSSYYIMGARDKVTKTLLIDDDNAAYRGTMSSVATLGVSVGISQLGTNVDLSRWTVLDHEVLPYYQKVILYRIDGGLYLLDSFMSAPRCTFGQYILRKDAYEKPAERTRDFHLLKVPVPSCKTVKEARGAILHAPNEEYSPRSIIWDKFLGIESPDLVVNNPAPECARIAMVKPDPSGYLIPPRLAELMRRRGCEAVDRAGRGQKTQLRMDKYYEDYRIWKENWDWYQIGSDPLEEDFIKGLDYEDLYVTETETYVRGKGFLQFEELAGVKPECWYKIIKKPDIKAW